MKPTYENGDPILSFVPIAANLDHRLSLVEYRVLVAIFSYRNRDTSVARVFRHTLAERCGYSPKKISEATAGLVALGWLEKEGNGGRSNACIYRITVPDLECETVPESGTVPKSGTVSKVKTVPESGATTVPESGTTTVPESGTGIEQSFEQSFEQSLGQAPEISDPPPLADGDPPPANGDPPPKANAERSIRMPDNWVVPDDWIMEEASRRGVALDRARREAEKFASHHAAKGSRFVSWRRAWSTWMINVEEWMTPKPIPTSKMGQGPSNARSLADMFPGAV